MPEVNPFEGMSDDELNDHINAGINEQEKRKRLAQVPNDIKTLGARFIEDGGSPEVLKEIF